MDGEVDVNMEREKSLDENHLEVIRSVAEKTYKQLFNDITDEYSVEYEQLSEEDQDKIDETEISSLYDKLK